MSKMAAAITVLALVSLVLVAEELAVVQRTCTVVDKDGNPVAGASVSVYLWEKSGASYTLKLSREAQTASDGQFTMTEPHATVLVAREGFALGWLNLGAWTPPASTVTLEPPAAISGVVVDDAGAPVKGARVEAEICKTLPGNLIESLGYPPVDLLAAATDAEGRFAFDRIPPSARVDFRVQAPGKALVTTSPLSARPGRFAPGQGDIRVVLMKEAFIEGTVVEKETGKGVSGVAIEAGGQDPARDERLAYGNVTSDPAGKFRFSGLGAGQYVLNVERPRDSLGDWVAEPVKVVTSAGDTTAGAKIEVQKGGVVEIEVRDSATDEPIPGVSVTASCPETYSARYTYGLSGGDGVVRLRLLPQTYYVGDFSRPGYSFDGHPRRITLAEGETARLTVKMPKSPRVKGTVVDESGNPVEGAVVMGKMVPGDSVKTDSEGHFEVQVTPYAQPDGDSGLARLVVRHPDRDLAAAVTVESYVAPLNVTLLPQRTVRGQVVDPDGKGIAGVSVHVYCDWERDAPYAEITTDATGSYKVKGLAVGAYYQIGGSAEGYGYAAHIATIEADSDLPYAVEDMAYILEDIVLPPARKSISGIVVDADGKGVSNARVEVLGPSQPERYAITDAQGKFTVQQIVERVVNVSATLPGTRLRRGTEAIGGDQDVRIVLKELAPSTPPKPKEPPSLVGKPLPDLKTMSADFDASAAEGKIVLVAFFDSNQRPSRKFRADLAARAGDLKASGVVIFGVDLVVGRAKEPGQPQEVPFPVAAATDAEKTLTAFGVRALPWLILTDKNHVVRTQGVMMEELDDKVKAIAEE